MYEITICLLHYKKLDKLKTTIQGIENNTNVPFIVKILNQGYLDSDIKDYLRYLEKRQNFQIIYKDHNLGPSVGRNILFQNIDTPYILSLDDDIYLPPNWFSEIRQFLEKFHEISVVGLSLINPEGQYQATAHNIRFKGRGIVKILDSVNPDPKTMIIDYFYDTDYVSEGAMVLKATALAQFSWDSELKVCFEGFDLGMQFRKNEVKAALFTGKFAIHDSISKDKSSREYIEERRNYHKIREDYIHMCKKWNMRFPFLKHFFYIFVCAVLPNSLLRWIALIWLNRIKPFFTSRNVKL